MMPHPVLHILGTAQPDGAGIARMVAALARGLDRERYTIHAWFLAGDGPVAGELAAAGAHVRVCNWEQGASDPVGAWRFWRSLRANRFAIIHEHFGGRSVRWLCRWTTGATLVVHLHGRIHEAQGYMPSPISLRGVDVAIATSRAVAECVVGVRPHVVYPGVRIPEAATAGSPVSKTATGRCVGTAGRLIPLKGIVYLIRALTMLGDDLGDVRLEIVGSGPERAVLEKEARSLGLEGRVKFSDWQTDLSSAMAMWDVYVQPSLEEAFGMAALEAMALGLPVVATAVGGLPELVEDGQTGWLVPAGDPAALAQRLRLLLLNPEQRRAMGAAGRARAGEHFSLERMVAAIAAIYDGILESRRQQER